MKTCLRLLSCLALLACPVWGAETIRVASYNIKYFSTGVTSQGDRLQKLKEVVDLLNADVIGLQEIKDRAALELLFPPADWGIVIDDASGDDQDVALVARKQSVQVKSQRFLFPDPQEEQYFPNHRDLLCVELGVTGSTNSFWVMVQHAKSRMGGRHATDPRREGTARMLVDRLRQDFDEKDFILLGDFNDNPDDRSMNILETGDPTAPGGPEEVDGPFLVNLMDQLCAENRVSHGRTASDIVAGRVNTVDPGSRERNNLARGTDQHTGDILFDQILFPLWMQERYVADSARVFDSGVALTGTGNSVASDHLPVSAEFDFSRDDDPPPQPAGLRIAALLPNPAGADERHEEVTIANGTTAAVDLAGHKLRDKVGNEFALSGVVPPSGRLTIILNPNSMPLNNGGDEVALLDPQGAEQHRVSYSSADVHVGQPVNFP